VDFAEGEGMNLTPVLIDALQEQLNLERLNSASYKAMSLALENANWPGSAKHFTEAAQDEQEHADKIASFLINRNIQPSYEQLDSPIVPAAEMLPMFEAAFQREKITTAAIDALDQLAMSECDRATCIFLQWFVMEQVASEREYVDKLFELDRARGNIAALLILDREYGA
jgi:ferritin